MLKIGYLWIVVHHLYLWSSEKLAQLSFVFIFDSDIWCTDVQFKKNEKKIKALQALHDAPPLR